MTSYVPAWQTEELAEEWVEHSTSLPSNGSSPSSTKSFDSTKFVARSTGQQGMRIVSGHTTFPSPHHSAPRNQQKRQPSTTYDLESPPTSNHSQSSASGSSPTAPGDRSTVPAGTFLVKPEDAVNDDDGLKRNPFIGGGGDIGAGDGGSLFQRLELERMFDPPREGLVAVREEDQPVGEEQRHGQGEVPLRRTSHSYVPVRPSRLSNSMTPSAGDTSMSSSGDGSTSMIRHGSQQPSRAPHEQVEEDSYEHGDSSSEDEAYPQHSTRRTTMRRFSGEPGSMRDVEFTFSPSPIRKRPSAQTLVTHTSCSTTSSDVSPSGDSPAAARGKKPFRLFQRQVDTEGYDSVRSRELIARIVVGGTPLRDLVARRVDGSPSPRAQGYMHGVVRNRVDSRVSGGRRHGQLAKQWSTSSGSPGSRNGSWSSGEVEERSSKRIRLSESGDSREEYEERGEDEEAVYGYSASGSEDAVDQRSLTASLNVSQSRSSKLNHHAHPFPVDASSASEAQEDEVVVNEGQRRSWGEKGQELLDRIRDVGTDKSDSWNSWSRSSQGAEGQGEAVQASGRFAD